MKEQLTLEDLSIHFPHRLECAFDNEDIAEIVGIELNRVHLISTIHGEYGYCDIHDLGRLLLRPLSDLTKPIKVEGYNDGKEFVPLVHMAKIEANGFIDIVDDPYVDDNGNYCVSYTDKFGINFLGINNYNGDMVCQRGSILDSARNQSKLFEFMAKCHIDYKGLVEKGLAIDMSTLSE